MYTGQYSKGENHVNGCPDEDHVCGINSLDGPKCGKHGTCEVTDVINEQYKCTCDTGYRSSGPGFDDCSIGKILTQYRHCFAYFIANIKSYSQMKIHVVFCPNSQEKKFN